MNKYVKNYKDLLDNYLRIANLKDVNVISEMGGLFEDTIKFIYELFGKNAFYLYRVRNEKWNWFSRPTTVIYDSLMTVAAEFVDHKSTILLKKPGIEDLLKDFYRENYGTFEGRNTNPSVIIERENKFREFFQNLTTHG